MVWPLYVPENVQRLTAGSKMDKSEAQQVIAQAKALVVEQVWLCEGGLGNSKPRFRAGYGPPQHRYHIALDRKC